jgi:hypothetical protein
MNKPTGKQSFRRHISLFVIVFAWLSYGEVTAFCMSHGYLLELGQLAHENVGQFIPSVKRIERLTNLDVALAKMHASTMLISMPALFIVFLFCNVEDSIAGVRKKGKETLAVAFLIAIASLVFVAGFSHNIGRSSFFAFSILSTLITGLSAYCYRVAFCVALKK